MTMFPESDSNAFESDRVPVTDASMPDAIPGGTEYDAITSVGDGSNDIPEDEPGEREPEVAEIADGAGRAAFGRLSVTQLEAAHPYKPAEAVEPGDIDDFYLAHAHPTQTWSGWRAVELAESTHNAEQLDFAGDHFDLAQQLHEPVRPNASVHDKFDTPRDAELWYDAAFAAAHLPAFRDRVDQGEVTAASAEQAYRALAEGVLPNTLSEGDAAEAIVSALGARAALLDRPGEYLWPSSPREGQSEHRTQDEDPEGHGQVFNHDMYRLDGDGKLPVEVKIRAGAGRRANTYHSDVVRVNCLNDLGGPILLGQDRSLQVSRTTARTLIPRFVLKAQRLMQAEIREGVERPELNLAAAALRRRLERY